MGDEQSYGGSYEPRMSAQKSDVVLEVRTLRKRTWSPAEKLSIVREGLQPGAKANEIMRRHGISSSLFYTWRKQALTATSTGFMPVQIAQPPAAPKDATPPASRIEILTRGGTTLRIEGAVDARTLDAVLKAMCR